MATTTPQLRPMSIGDLLDSSFRLYRSQFVTFIGIVALLQVPSLILQLLIQLTVGRGPFEAIMQFSMRPPVPRPGQNILELFPINEFLTFYAVSIGVGLFQGLIVQSLMTGALANAVSRSYLRQTTSILDAYRLGARRFGAMVLVTLLVSAMTLVLVGLLFGCIIGVFGAAISSGDQSAQFQSLLIFLAALFAGLLLFLLVLLLLGVRLIFLPQAVFLEGSGPLESFRRSWRLVSGSFWRVLLILVLMTVLAYLISVLPATIVNTALSLSGRPTVERALRNQIITTLIAQVGVIVSLPLQLSLFTLLYYDLRVRKEGYDIELMSRQNAQL